MVVPALRFEASQSEFFVTLNRRVNDYFSTAQLSRKGSWQTLIKTALMLLLYLGPFAAILTNSLNGWGLLISSILMGVGMAGMGMAVMHDAAHSATSNRGWLNRLTSRSIYLLGSNRLNWKLQHNHYHHNFTNVIGVDEDIGGRSVLRFSPHLPHKKIHRFQHIYAFPLYGLLTISKLVKDFFQLRRYSTNNGEMFNLCFTKAAYLVVVLGLPLLMTDLSWWQVIFGFTLMHLVGGFIMAIVFQLAHLVEAVEQPLPNSAGAIESDWAIHQLKTTANFSTDNYWLTWFVGGLNFQVEHHLFPAVSHVHYAAIAPIVQRTAVEFGVPYHRYESMAAAVRSHRRLLRKLGSQPALNLNLALNVASKS